MTDLTDVPQAIRDAAIALLDAVTDNDYLGAAITVEQTGPDAVTVDVTIRPRPGPDPITLTIVPTIPEADAERHDHDLVLVSTLTRETVIGTCARYNHGTSRTDFVHTAGPCPLP